MKKDLTGQRFGRLVVIGEEAEPYISPSGIKTRRWKCRCDCGSEITVLQSTLTSKNGTRSCGCARTEKTQDKMIDMTGQRFGRLTVIEKATLPKKQANGAVTGWLCRCDCGREVVYSRKDLLSGKITSCGCLLREESRKTVAEKVGQVDGTTLSAISPDRKPNKNNKSGVKGVYYSKTEKCWIAKIGVKRKTITIGRFCSREDAAEARKKAEEKYFVPILEEHKK